MTESDTIVARSLGLDFRNPPAVLLDRKTEASSSPVNACLSARLFPMARLFHLEACRNDWPTTNEVTSGRRRAMYANLLVGIFVGNIR